MPTNDIIKKDVELKHYTTVRLGGKARYWCEPKNLEEVKFALKFAQDNLLDVFILGKGSNIVARNEGVAGLVLYTGELVGVEFENTDIYIESGYSLKRLISFTVKKGLSGLEWLVEIPASLGGAVFMNAGGRFGSIGEVVEKCWALNFDTCELVELERKDLHFSYRKSNLQNLFVYKIKLKLSSAPEKVILDNLQKTLEYKTTTQPLSSYNVGCIFKNPLNKSAAELIERCGLKNYKVGNAYVSPKHANFFINTGDNSDDYLKLIEFVQSEIFKTFGVKLEREIKIWPDEPNYSFTKNKSENIENTDLPAVVFSRTFKSEIPLNDLMKYRIYVLCGGDSPEREISLKTAENIYQTLQQKGFKVFLLDCPHLEDFDLGLINSNTIFFLAFHGGFGEDGRMQKILEEHKAYFTGSGAYASTVAMNKLQTKLIALNAGINTPNYLHFKFNQPIKAYRRSTAFSIDQINIVPQLMQFPLIIKPVNLGSTVGVKVCKNFNQLKDAISEIKQLDSEFLVEDFLSGEEITVAVLRNKALPPIRLKYEDDIFDYNLKYKDKKVEYEFLETNYKNINFLAEKIFKEIKCYSYARIDFRSDGNTLYLLEINTLPGLTKMSLFPKSAKKCGIEFEQLLIFLLEDALKRYEKNSI
jgi:UDP-N-acetylenolpyruvoylglucosamine reductase